MLKTGVVKVTQKRVKRNIGNRVIALAAASMMAVIAAVNVAPVFANNNSDTYECFSFSGENSTNSDWRHKRDTTSCWLKCYDSSDSDQSFEIHIYGTDQHQNYGGSVCDARPYTFYEGKTMYMENYVYENYSDGEECPDGDSNAVMYYVASPIGSMFDDFDCWWSPDNMSGYHYDHVVED